MSRFSGDSEANSLWTEACPVAASLALEKADCRRAVTPGVLVLWGMEAPCRRADGITVDARGAAGGRAVAPSVFIVVSFFTSLEVATAFAETLGPVRHGVVCTFFSRICANFISHTVDKHAFSKRHQTMSWFTNDSF